MVALLEFFKLFSNGTVDCSDDRILWVVGGFVRDRLLNYTSKDIDFAIEASSYEDMRDYLVRKYPGFELVREDTQYGRLIGGIPTKYLNWTAREYEKMYGKLPPVIFADFVLARSEGDYSDGRHPDRVVPASIQVDLGRRDFTVNAIAVNDATGEFLDPYDGVSHAKARKLFTVQNPHDTFTQDMLRLLRYYRFQVTKNLDGGVQVNLDISLYAEVYGAMLTTPLFHDRIREELAKMLKADTPATLHLLVNNVPKAIQNAIFRDVGIWFIPTNKQR